MESLVADSLNWKMLSSVMVWPMAWPGDRSPTNCLTVNEPLVSIGTEHFKGFANLESEQLLYPLLHFPPPPPPHLMLLHALHLWWPHLVLLHLFCHPLLLGLLLPLTYFSLRPPTIHHLMKTFWSVDCQKNMTVSPCHPFAAQFLNTQSNTSNLDPPTCLSWFETPSLLSYFLSPNSPSSYLHCVVYSTHTHASLSAPLLLVMVDPKPKLICTYTLLTPFLLFEQHHFINLALFPDYESTKLTHMFLYLHTFYISSHTTLWPMPPTSFLLTPSNAIYLTY